MQIGTGNNAHITGAIDNAISAQTGIRLDAAQERTPEEAGEHFEQMLATMLVKEMRSGLDEGFFGSGPGAGTFSAWLDDHLGRVMAEQGVLGTADLVSRFAADVEQASGESDSDEGMPTSFELKQRYHALEADEGSMPIDLGPRFMDLGNGGTE